MLEKNQQVFVGIDVNCVVRTVDLGATVMAQSRYTYMALFYI